MNKQKAIPSGYLTVGELAKKMNTTVRTLQYYDREKLLTPSMSSEGGRRLYTNKDVVMLHQIQSMKSLGFTLSDIKNRLVSLETPEDVAETLANQAEVIRKQITNLTETLETIERLGEETLLMHTVDFKKYADIVVNLQMKNEFYGFIKYFDDKMLDYLRNHLDMESGTAIKDTLSRLISEMEELQKNKISPESEEGQAVAKQWWDMVIAFTGGDMSLLPGLMKMADNKEIGNEAWSERWLAIETFLQQALGEYFTKIGYDPLEGAEQ